MGSWGSLGESYMLAPEARARVEPTETQNFTNRTVRLPKNLTNRTVRVQKFLISLDPVVRWASCALGFAMLGDRFDMPGNIQNLKYRG